VPDAGRRADPVVSPWFEPDRGGLPAALIVTAEHDPLRDEGAAAAAAADRIFDDMSRLVKSRL
jgi:acetyl esterase